MAQADGRAKPGSLARLVEELAPGGRLVRMRRLRGGLGSRTHLLNIKGAAGDRCQAVLRRYLPSAHQKLTPERATREFEILRIIEAAGIPAPRPVLLDADGRHFGVPAMVLSYLPGRPLFASRDVQAWIDGLARALQAVHAVTPERFDLSDLQVYLRDGMRQEIEHQRERAAAGEPLAQEVHAVLDAELDRIDWPAPSLVHDDYWPGNTVWYRGQLVGIIDWTQAELGDPRADVAQCRVDLVLSHGMDVADAFLGSYQAAAPQPLPDIWFFDLFRGLRALFSYERWLIGYHDLGLTHLSAAATGARLRAFLQRALNERRRDPVAP